MKKMFFFTCCIFLLTTARGYADVGAIHIEKAGGFSFQAPKGWQFREFPGMKYQIAFGAATNSFSPNMNVVDEAYEGSLKNYVDINLINISKVFVQYKQIKRNIFVTNTGLKIEKVITSSLQQNMPLRQTFYFLPGINGKYFVVTCSTLASTGDKLDAVFDESMKTFEIIKPVSQ